jgi:hypothetical protein
MSVRSVPRGIAKASTTSGFLGQNRMDNLLKAHNDRPDLALGKSTRTCSLTTGDSNARLPAMLRLRRPMPQQKCLPSHCGRL